MGVTISHPSGSFQIFAFRRFPQNVLLDVRLEAFNYPSLDAGSAIFIALWNEKLPRGKMVSSDKGESENLIKLTSVHSDECHFGLQSFISSGLQSSNVAGFAFKSQSLSSAKPSFLMHTTVRDLDALKQSPEHNVHGPINQSPWHLMLLVHSRYVLGVRRMSQRSVLGGLRSQKIVRNCWPAPHSLEHCSLLRTFQLKVIWFRHFN